MDQIEGPALGRSPSNELNNLLLVLAVATLEVVRLVARFAGRKQLAGHARSGRRRDRGFVALTRHLSLQGPQYLFSAPGAFLCYREEGIGYIEDTVIAAPFVWSHACKSCCVQVFS